MGEPPPNHTHTHTLIYRHILPLINPPYQPPLCPLSLYTPTSIFCLTASPPSPTSSKGSLSLLSLLFLCQWGMPLDLCNNKAFKGWWYHSSYSLWPAYGSRKITCWCPLWGDTEREGERENGQIGSGGWVSARQTKPWLSQGCHASCCPWACPHTAVFAQACPHYEWLSWALIVSQSTIQRQGLKAVVNMSTDREWCIWFYNKLIVSNQWLSLLHYIFHSSFFCFQCPFFSPNLFLHVLSSSSVSSVFICPWGCGGHVTMPQAMKKVRDNSSEDPV